MDKKAIVDILEEMGTLLELQGANPFKSRAFHNASRALAATTADLHVLIAPGGFDQVKGIGKGIAQVIADLATKDSSEDYLALKRALPSGLLEMMKIEGLGPKRIKLLHDMLGISTLAELEAAAKKDQLSSAKGFGKKTQESILKGIEALRVRHDKTLYPVALEAAEDIHRTIVHEKGVLRAEVAGSLRRKKEVIGDIDIVASVRQADRERVMKAFAAHPRVSSVIARGETKTTVVLNDGIHCDLRVVTDQEYPFALCYFTGSKEHNVEIRSRARTYGLSLNEYGFTSLDGKKKAVKCKDEADVYAALKLDYIPPELRENTGEIEAAAKHRLPHLVEDADIRGTFHCHTTYSDGLHSLEQMAQAAHEHGWDYLGIADHSKAAAYAGGLTRERVKQQFREIDALNKNGKGARLLKGTECDILTDGSLDWPDSVLKEFDYVVVSVHSAFKMTEAAMTKRIISALKHKHVTMLGHPTGRLLLARDAYPVNMIHIIDAAADYGKMIEINAHPSRLDLDWRLCSYAKEKGVMIAINPDAHSIDDLRFVPNGVAIARKGWLEKSNIVNTRRLPEVLTLFHHS